MDSSNAIRHAGCLHPDREEVVHLHDLDNGDRFRLPGTGRRGTLRKVGVGHAVVDYDGGDIVRFKKYEDTPEEEVITFERPRKDEVISKCSVVEPLEADHG